MLKHNERFSLVESLTPPSGYRLGAALGTTFSMDFITLTSVMLAFVDAENQAEGSDHQRIQTLHALACLSDRVRIFVNRGYIHHAASETDKTFALFDRVVRELEFIDGIFHPKVWLLKFRPQDTAEMHGACEVYRLIIMTRNLTTANSWELAICLEGVKTRVKNPLAGQLAAFFRKVIRASDHPKESATHSVMSMLEDLPVVEFKSPLGSPSRPEFLWQWPSKQSLARYIPSTGGRALVLSPYLRESFVRLLLERFDDIIIVSTRSSLDGLDDDLYRALADHQLYAVVCDLPEEDLPAMALHAKLYIFEDNGKTRVFLGSANATTSGWYGNNCEALLAWDTSPTIDEFEAAFIWKDKQSLYSWISQYEVDDRIRTTDEMSQEEELERRLDTIHRELSHLRIVASYDQARQILGLKAANAAIVTEILDSQNEDIRVEFAPLSLFDRSNSETGRPLLPIAQLLKPCGVEFDRIPVSLLTEFVCLEICCGNRSKKFVIKADTDFRSLAKERDRGLMRDMMNRERFEAILHLILFDGARRSLSFSEYANKSREQQEDDRPPLLLGEAVTVEDVLKSCTEDPSRIAEIDDFLKGLEGADYIDRDFLFFWEEFSTAVRMVKGGSDD